MKHCYGYVRVSTKKQGEGVSLEAQKDAIEHFASTSNIKIIKWYEELQTAAKGGRPVFAAMLKALRQKKQTVGVVMHKVDRSARNFTDWAKIGDLADAGIDVHFAAESLDFNSRGGRLCADIQAVIASDFIRNHKTEVRKGQRGRLERGLYPFSAPLGYVDNGKGKLKTIDPKRGPLIRQAFELYGSGQYSLPMLTEEMAKRGLRNKQGNIITFNRWAEILDNPFYTGLIKIRRTGETFEGKHEPLISTKLFHRVVRVRGQREHKLSTKHNHLYRGLFKCGVCQCSMVPELQKGHVYYRCHRPDCKGNSVREEELESSILEYLSRTRINDRHIKHIRDNVARWIKHARKDSGENTITLQLSKLDQKLDRLEDAVIDGLIGRERFLERKERLLQERSVLEEERSKTADLSATIPKLEQLLELSKTLAAHHQYGSPQEKREITEIAFSNRNVKAKNISVEPKKWLKAVNNSTAFLSCVHHRGTSRTFTPQQCDSIAELVDAVRTPEVEELLATFVDGYRKSAGLDGKEDKPEVQ